MRRAFLLAFVLAMAATACGGRAPGGTASPTAPSSGIEGRTVAGPTCPVERAESPCPPKVVPGATVVAIDRATGRSWRAASDAEGTFRLALAPGTYLVHGEWTSAPSKVTQPLTVQVRPGEFTPVVVGFDTGIR